MENLAMQTANLADEKFRALVALFPNAITETTDAEGRVVRAIDKDILAQEIATAVVEGPEERYRFTWPDKRAAMDLANTPTTQTLRPCREESVNFDTTENLYIEGDNLDVLKLLRENYLGQVKMIYIDPPYNTGSDFIYDDDFSQSTEDYLAESGQFDEAGNRMVRNTETNGRFHTDWLNMIYPRLKLARDLLTEDGVIFISIDYNENYNIRKILNEIFGESSFVGEICWESKTKSQNTVTSFNKLQPKTEMILVYSRLRKKRFNLIKKGDREYPLSDEKGVYREHFLEVMNANGIRGRETMIFDISDGVSTVSLPEGKQWKLGQDQVATYKNQGELFIRDNKVVIKMRPEYERNETTEPFWGFISKEFGTAESAKKELMGLIGAHGFETVKPMNVIKRLCYHATNDCDMILDFFSGSATTAHAVMQLNTEDGGHRKFIMVQIPETFDEKSEAYKAGYKNICEIGKERIRRAATKIAEAHPEAAFDGGFRVLKLDSSNMKEVYYAPSEYTADLFSSLEDNIKADRTPEDLLFQVMPELSVPLSAKIEERIVAGKRVFFVKGNYLVACFDRDVTEETITAVAKEKPYYFVLRDSSIASDSVATNFDQIFAAYSPDTVRRVL